MIVCFYQEQCAKFHQLEHMQFYQFEHCFLSASPIGMKILAKNCCVRISKINVPDRKYLLSPRFAKWVGHCHFFHVNLCLFCTRCAPARFDEWIRKHWKPGWQEYKISFCFVWWPWKRPIGSLGKGGLELKHALHGYGGQAGCPWAWWWHAWRGWRRGWCLRRGRWDRLRQHVAKQG